jgi:hypothetical protein
MDLNEKNLKKYIIYLWNGKDFAAVQKATFHLPRVYGRPAAEVKKQSEKERKNGFELTIQGKEVPYGSKITIHNGGVSIDKKPNTAADSEWNAFQAYSWNAWFESMTLEQLLKLRQTWYRAIQRSTGHEHKVMVYDMRQLNAKIMDLQDGLC